MFLKLFWAWITCIAIQYQWNWLIWEYSRKLFWQNSQDRLYWNRKYLLWFDLWFPLDSCVQFLKAHVTTLEKGPSKSWLRLSEIRKVGAWSDRIDVFKWKGRDTRALPLVRLWYKVDSVCKLGRVLTTAKSSWQMSSKNMKKINFYSLFHLVGSNLLWECTLPILCIISI